MVDYIFAFWAVGWISGGLMVHYIFAFWAVGWRLDIWKSYWGRLNVDPIK